MKVHYRVLKPPPLFHVLSQFSPVHTFMPYSSKKRYYPTIQFSGLSLSHNACYMPSPLTLFPLITNRMVIYYTLIVQFSPPACFSASCPRVFIK
jgi:hypothetical protein